MPRREVAVSDVKEVPVQPTPAAAPEAPAAQANAAAANATAPAEKLDGVEEIDFLLEEIESKIAPLALA